MRESSTPQQPPKLVPDVSFNKEVPEAIYRNHLLVAASVAEREGFIDTRDALIGLLANAVQREVAPQ